MPVILFFGEIVSPYSIINVLFVSWTFRCIFDSVGNSGHPINGCICREFWTKFNYSDVFILCTHYLLLVL